MAGIAGNTKYLNLRDRISLTLYLPYRQWNQTGSIVFRTSAPLRQTY
jgi:hypothetical protein